MARAPDATLSFAAGPGMPLEKRSCEPWEHSERQRRISSNGNDTEKSGEETDLWNPGEPGAPFGEYASRVTKMY